ncbi:L-threonine 3-O-phosphate decarboxylase [Furfurilactobacillus rossiae]|uniref:threonine-phosphate decarboxylase CobD n=1 Tax=Furfurilactobacillus rossiae TaxID=231049 RepID=UPI0015BEB3BE|nr:threonine-phosphate decarboxylase CobD [Furfurilactobacillus rossiae]MCF6165861.1 threonine-phosphate decarboxylase CobD [Furfurilactobacillus rossiae]QLE64426.1 L-threonine 3-O-phosphate decarboxylase [Furfurilactobacillus rossiae]
MSIDEHGGNIDKIARQLKIKPESLIDFSANINPLGMPTAFKQLLAETTPKTTVYPNPDYPKLRAAIADHFVVRSHNVVVGNGAMEILRDVALATAVHHVVVIEPAFNEYAKAFQSIGATVYSYITEQNNGFRLSIPMLIDWVSRHLNQCQAICLGNPNNPTGQRLSPDELKPLIDFCTKNHIWLIVDEAFMSFTFDERLSVISSLRNEQFVFVIRSATKFYAMPGLRLGFGITKNEYLLNRLKQVALTWSVNTYAQTLGEQMYAQTEFQIETKKWLIKERKYLFNGLAKFPEINVFPSAANFLFFWSKDEQLRAHLLHKHLVIRSCANYPGLDEHYYRVAVKGHDDNEVLLEALQSVLGEGVKI